MTPGWPRMTPGWPRMTPGWLSMTPGWLQDDSRMTPEWHRIMLIIFDDANNANNTNNANNFNNANDADKWCWWIMLMNDADEWCLSKAGASWPVGLVYVHKATFTRFGIKPLLLGSGATLGIEKMRMMLAVYLPLRGPTEIASSSYVSNQKGGVLGIVFN